MKTPQMILRLKTKEPEDAINVTATSTHIHFVLKAGYSLAKNDTEDLKRFITLST